MVVTNTLFEKDEPQLLITHRNATTPCFSLPFTTERFSQLDYILINSRWNKSITHVETTSFHAVTSDHKLLVAHVRIKLAKHTDKTDKRVYEYTSLERPLTNRLYNTIISLHKILKTPCSRSGGSF